jgi:hypothetical protein
MMNEMPEYIVIWLGLGVVFCVDAWANYYEYGFNRVLVIYTVFASVVLLSGLANYAVRLW